MKRGLGFFALLFLLSCERDDGFNVGYARIVTETESIQNELSEFRSDLGEFRGEWQAFNDEWRGFYETWQRERDTLGVQ